MLSALVVLLAAHPLAVFIRTKAEELLKGMPHKRSWEKWFGREFFIVVYTVIPYGLQGFVYFLGFVASAQLIGINIIQPIFYNLVMYLPRVLYALIYLFGGYFLSKATAKFIDEIVESLQVTDLRPFSQPLGAFVQYFILTISLLLAISQLGFETGLLNMLLIGFISITTFAFFWFLHTASAPYLPDLFAGMAIKRDRLFIPGEYVIYEGKKWRVMRVGAIKTTLRTSNKQIYLRNSVLLHDAVKVINDEKGKS